MTKTTIQILSGEIETILRNPESMTRYAICDRVEVTTGSGGDCDTDYCNRNGIPVFGVKRDAGCCVGFPGNVCIADIRRGKGIAHKLITDFCTYLTDRGLDARIDNNDVLVNGYKTASAEMINIAPDYTYSYSCANFPVNVNVDTINKICLKPMKKIPRGLSEYGITTDDIVDWLAIWFAGNDKMQVDWFTPGR